MIMSTRGQRIKPNWEFSHDWFSWHSARGKWVVLWVVVPGIPSQTGDCLPPGALMAGSCVLVSGQLTPAQRGPWSNDIPQKATPNPPSRLICEGLRIIHSPPLLHFFLVAFPFIFGGGGEYSPSCSPFPIMKYTSNSTRLLWVSLEIRSFSNTGRTPVNVIVLLLCHLLLVHSYHTPLYNWDLEV